MISAEDPLEEACLDDEYNMVILRCRHLVMGEYLISGRRDGVVDPSEKVHNKAIDDVLEAIDRCARAHENRAMK